MESITKKCTECGLEKSRDEFYRNKSGNSYGRCKKCQNKYSLKWRDENEENKKKHSEYVKKWKAEHPEHQREWRKRNADKVANYELKQFGIDYDEYNRIFEKQNGACAICGRNSGKKKLHVDHDHKTGKVRALLCSNCNMSLGLVREDTNVLEKMIRYIFKHKEQKCS